MGAINTYINLLPKKWNVRLALGIIFVWLGVAVSAPVLEQLIGVDYSALQTDEGLLAPLSDGTHVYHLLGTDYLGRDLLAGMIHGARVAFVISFVSVFLSLLVGISVGLFIGYYGDKGIRKNLVQQAIILCTLCLSSYYFFSMISNGFSVYNMFPMAVTLGLGYFLERASKKLPIKSYGLPLDIIMQRVFELRESIPGLFIILSIAALLSSQSILSVALLIAILFWITFARHARAETWSVKEEDYIKSAKSSGISDFQLLTKHILPNALPSIYVIIAFTFSSVILLESSLSFLGIGMPVEEVSWGKILAEARNHAKAWWLAVFPGLAIFLVLYAFNTLGDYLAQYQRRN